MNTTWKDVQDLMEHNKLPAVTNLMGQRCGDPPHPLDDVNEIQINHQLHSSKYEVPQIDLWYPRLEGHCKAVRVGLSCTRAACSLHITFSHERDEWVVSKQRWDDGTDDYVLEEVTAISGRFLDSIRNQIGDDRPL